MDVFPFRLLYFLPLEWYVFQPKTDVPPIFTTLIGSIDQWNGVFLVQNGSLPLQSNIQKLHVQCIHLGQVILHVVLHRHYQAGS